MPRDRSASFAGWLNVDDLFYNPLAGAIDEGRWAPGYDEPGHDRHMHVSTYDAPSMLAIIGEGQRRGLRVSENPYVGTVHLVHKPGSDHYQRFRDDPRTPFDESRVGRALDVSGEGLLEFAVDVVRGALGRDVARPRPAGSNVTADPDAHGRAGQGARMSSRLRRLWVDAGGEPSLAPTMEAIALAESRGNANAHALTEKEDSRGLWQINIRAHPELARWNLYDPQTNARAAVHVHAKQGLGAWSTYTSGAYLAYMGGFLPPAPGPRVRPGGDDDSGGRGFFGGLWHAAEGGAGWAWEHTLGPIHEAADFLRMALWLVNPRNWLRAVEFVVGMWLLVVGLAGLAVVFLGRDPKMRRAAESAVGFRFGKAALAGAGIERATRGTRARGEERRAEREAAQSERVRKARERGRRRERNAEREQRFREQYPDYDVIPF